MQIQVWRIQGGQFHFGKQGLGQEETRVTFPSDSLFAALIARLALLEGDAAVKKFIEPFCEGRPPFVITSTFPFAEDIFFFPVPLASLIVKKELSKEIKFKSLKKVKYVSEKIYRQLIAGKSLIEFAQERETFWALPEEKIPEKIWMEERRPRVTIERDTNKSTLYFTGSVTFAKNCGLWFGIRWLDEDDALKSQVMNLLADLGEAGLGAERSAGMGKADIKSESSLELPNPSSTGAWTSLSRYLPRDDKREMNAFQDSQAAYNIERVGGWLDSHTKRGQRRRPVNMLTEGAVLGAAGSETPGRVEDVAPKYGGDEDHQGHPVYRSGIALAVGFGGPA